ncbi:uncharacterized protein (TIGR02453 family) [Arcticibacter pallidicorallinus]|uniref:Uncharacterized protein (TIGR02453 family) n=1 Tax=Arcticibacter pallidicorallinus TaxID=1259464 RepID=A0A2T0U8S3_9SPHI|nr:DUF2461 domain-containing protein [Arcticibacter pallidicorallinus]PRY54330.1 uncharacterized protein (TIGR02453 family) [Arcticibacter pallidicorallinus]
MKIEQSTFTFLSSLAKNNNREWFQNHKSDYEASRENILAFTQELIKGIASFDPTVPSALDPKTCVMRIYRDVRFSLNKLPYKTNFGIGISAAGKNFPGPGYYIHIAPNASFVGGGSWHPAADELKDIRQEIDYNFSDWLSIIENDDFKTEFEALDTEDKLKTSPKGYPSDHPGIEYLKLKSFVVSKQLSNKQLSAETAIDSLTRTARKLYPFMNFLRSANS